MCVCVCVLWFSVLDAEFLTGVRSAAVVNVGLGLS